MDTLAKIKPANWYTLESADFQTVWNAAESGNVYQIFRFLNEDGYHYTTPLFFGQFDHMRIGKTRTGKRCVQLIENGCSTSSGIKDNSFALLEE